MEWTELQALWQQYDARITENTRINKEVLKRMLWTKSERRINRITLQTGASLFVNNIVLLLFFTLAPLKFNHGLVLYLGISLFAGGVLLVNFWSIKYFILLRNIDFTHSVIATRKHIEQVEKFQTKRIKLGYSFLPISFIGVFLLFDMLPFTKLQIVFLSLMFVVAIVSMYYEFRWKNWWFGKLNLELDEIEQLEKE